MELLEGQISRGRHARTPEAQETCAVVTAAPGPFAVLLVALEFRVLREVGWRPVVGVVGTGERT